MFGLKASVLVAAVTFALMGAASAQTGRSSTHTEAGPAGASTSAQMMRQGGMRSMRSQRMMRRHHMRRMHRM